MRRFELTEQHVRLLRRASCDSPDHAGAPGLNVKRPFGNSDVAGDMHAIVFGTPAFRDLNDEVRETLWDRVYRPMFDELYTALAVVLTAQTFQPGAYVADDYSNQWRREEGKR